MKTGRGKKSLQIKRQLKSFKIIVGSASKKAVVRQPKVSNYQLRITRKINQPLLLSIEQFANLLMIHDSEFSCFRETLWPARNKTRENRFF